MVVLVLVLTDVDHHGVDGVDGSYGFNQIILNMMVDGCTTVLLVLLRDGCS